MEAMIHTSDFGTRVLQAENPEMLGEDSRP
jgi:hypothetical protein